MLEADAYILYDEDRVCRSTSSSCEGPPRRVAGWELFFVLILLMLTGTTNFVLVKVLYSTYGECYAFFVSQGINVIYVVYGGLLVCPRLLPWGLGDTVSRAMNFDPITPAMRRSPHRRFLSMGILDCFGTFFTALGAVYTPGQFQTLLNQSLIPCTLIVSIIMLRRTRPCTSSPSAMPSSVPAFGLRPIVCQHGKARSCPQGALLSQADLCSGIDSLRRDHLYCA